MNPRDEPSLKPDPGKREIALGARSGPTIVLMQMRLFNFAERDHRIPGRTRLDLFARDIEADMPVGPVHAPYRLHGDQYALAQPPVACVDDEVTEAPVVVFEHEVLDVSDISVECVDMISYHLDDAAKVGVALLGVDV